MLDGEQTREQALATYGAFSDAHAWKFLWLKRVQNLVSRINPTPVMPLAVRGMTNERLLRWAFEHYLNIAPPSFATASPAPRPAARAAA